MIRWLRQHGRVFLQTLRRFKAQPVAVLLNTLVIGVALSLPTAGYVLLNHARAAADGVAARPQLSLFLQVDASAETVSQLKVRLENHPAVAAVRFVPKDTALEQLAQSTGLGDLTQVLDGNPLSDAFVIDAKDLAPPALDRLREEMSRWPGVEHVQVDSGWARRLDALLRLGRTGMALLGGLLALALVLTTFNTIRLQILTQRDEIELSKLIGATDGFIRRPFLYYGTLLGLLGGVAAWAIVEGSLRLLADPVAELAQLYGAAFRLTSLGIRDSLGLLGLSAALGWLGASLSVARHLRDIEPR
ncbi:MAG: ABC transporter permease [Azospira oryzae]|nr:MAG: ABC transporter permease [Azospira oryzae]PZP80802.1 MAG: ABC transporter permease [Azospira oryzae]